MIIYNPLYIYIYNGLYIIIVYYIIVFVSFPYKLIVDIFAITFSIAFLNQSLENIQLESKLDFTFVSFQYKLNFLDFCCYFFSELISIFFILF